MDRSGTSLALGIGLLIAAAVIVDAVFTGRNPWDIVLAVTRGEAVPKASATPGTVNAPAVAGSGAASTKATLPGFLPLGSTLKQTLAVTFAMSALGTPYSATNRWGGIGPNGGVDCSSFTFLAAKAAGETIGSNSYEQATNGNNVPLNPASVQPGDLIFYKGDSPRRNLGHVAIALNSMQQVAAPHTGSQVQVQPIRWDNAGPNSENGVQMIRRVF